MARSVLFDILMTGSIAFLTVMLDVRGLAPGALPITIAMTVVAVSAAALLVSMLHGLRTRHWRPLHVIP